jgi:phosphonate metabolism protein PhnN/1,5-bisphosphokinase (PRPP-forming)
MRLPPLPCSERLLVVVGPSGAGKDSVLRAWRERLGDAPVHFARRTITRAPEASERHESVDEAEFGRLRAAGELATWWHAHGLLYGVRHSELDALAQGRWVVLNGSRAHLDTIRGQAPQLRSVEITASAATLAARLSQRGREDARAVQQRLSRAPTAEVSLRLVNDGPLHDAVEALHAWWLSGRACPSASARA